MQIYAVVHSPALPHITWRPDKLCRHTQRHRRRHNVTQTQTISAFHFRSQATSLLFVMLVLHDNCVTQSQRSAHIYNTIFKHLLFL